MNVLITGSKGFLGINLSNALRLKYKNIFFLERNINEYSSNVITYDHLTVDFLNQNNINVIIHLAGKAHDIKNVKIAEEYYLINFGLTKKIFDIFKKSNTNKFIYVSSVKASSDQVLNILEENHPPKPTTHYGKSKLMAENYILLNSSQDKKFFILRPSMIHGPGNKGNLNFLYNFLLKTKFWPLASFKNKRSLCSVGNFCFVIDEILSNNKIESGIYNIADDDPISTNEIVMLIARSLKIKIFYYKFPKIFINALGHFGDLLHLNFNTEKLVKLTENYLVSNKKITNAIGKKLPLSTIDGLLITFDWLTNNKKNN
jgi:nucleoside-diphosphate-sugar epimerase